MMSLLLSLLLGCGAVMQHAVPLPPELADAPDWKPDPAIVEGDGFVTRELAFPCGEPPTTCAGTMYLPTHVQSPPPVVVMAHGFTGERDMSLPAYAERFAQAGLAAFTFDYRGWGDSGGLPRYEIVAEAQVADYLDAIAFVRTLEVVDGERVGAWGTSFSGGHVIFAAHRDGQLDAVVTQVPMVNGLAEPEGAEHEGELAWPLVKLSFKDKLRELGDKERIYVPAFPEPGQVGFLIGEEAAAARDGLVPEDSDWPNLVAPAILIDFDEYHPHRVADEVTAPTLFVLGTQDVYVSNRAAEKAAASMPDARLEWVEAGHFDVYGGTAMEAVLAVEVPFLVEVLGAVEDRAPEG